MYDDDRNSFIILDVLAKKRGGLAMLTLGEQIEYLVSGIDLGFLNVNEAHELAIGLHIENNRILSTHFKSIEKSDDSPS